ncbi:hypothetical protein BD779DRAFT_955341 [Infundibulicybe gibba]|nr:hypothetical protein BD779DRAFT_955341 [Infundibulicybe gibba]
MVQIIRSTFPKLRTLQSSKASRLGKSYIINADQRPLFSTAPAVHPPYTMIMEKRQDDQWTSNPPSVESTFILKPKESAQDINFTETCGFGWRFRAQTSTPLAGTSYADVFTASKIGPFASMCITLAFDPFIVRGAQLGYVRILTTMKASTTTEFLVFQPQERNQAISFPPPPQATNSPLPNLGSFIWTGDINFPPIFSFHVKFSSTLGLHFPTSPPPKALKLLSDSLLGLDQTDVKFYLFSRRNKTGQKTHPQSLFASTQILRGQSSHLDHCINVPIATDIDCISAELANFSGDEYDYDSDSDLDTDDDDQIASPPLGVNFSREPVHTTLQSPRSSVPEAIPIPEHGKEPRAPAGRVGRIVFIPDISYKTWKALIWYLYTHEISFRPLASQAREINTSVVGSSTPPCSPKSMYRLANKLGIEELRALSLTAIQSGITKENILKEMFCKFTSYYPEIQEFESTFLISHFASIPTDEVDRAGNLLEGEGFPHPVGILWKVIRKTLSSPGPTLPQPPAPQPLAPPAGPPKSIQHAPSGK